MNETTIHCIIHIGDKFYSEYVPFRRFVLTKSNNKKNITLLCIMLQKRIIYTLYLQYLVI